MAKYTGSYLIIDWGHTNVGISILKITGRVGTTTGGEKTIPVGKGSYEIVMPLDPEIKLKRYVQRILHTTIFRDSSFLNNRQVLQRLFEKKWNKHGYK